MAKKSSKIAWGYDGNVFIHIDDATSGINCGCACPECGTPLIAKKGNIKDWHFAHEQLSNCQGESALHQLGKQAVVDIASQKDKITLPSQYYQTFVQQKPFIIKGNLSCAIDNKDECASRLLSAKEEVKRGALVFDTLANADDFDELVVEIFVTHKKTGNDIIKFKAMGISAFEIDLSYLPWNASYSDIISAVKCGAPRKWLSHHQHELFIHYLHSTTANANSQSDLPIRYITPNNNEPSIISSSEFADMDHKDKMIFLATGASLQIIEKQQTSCFENHWNTHNTYWQNAVLKYIVTPLLKQQTYTICARDITYNNILCHLFDMKDKSINKRREILTYQFLLKLHHKGIIQHDHSTFFTLTKLRY